jgi:hypothetical protein
MIQDLRLEDLKAVKKTIRQHLSTRSNKTGKIGNNQDYTSQD